MEFVNNAMRACIRTLYTSYRKESHLILLAGLLRGLLFSVTHVMHGFALLLMFASFTLSTGQPLTPSIVFTSIVLFNTVNIVVVEYLIKSTLGVQESRVALSRIEVCTYILCMASETCPKDQLHII